MMEKHINDLIGDSLKAGLSKEEIRTLLGITKKKKRKFTDYIGRKVVILIVVAYGLVLSAFLTSKIGGDLLDGVNNAFCFVDHTLLSMEFGRPVTNCSFCKDLFEVPKLSEISRDLFTKQYAYSGIPLVVTNATSNWTAFEVFNFKFLKKLYKMRTSDSNSDVNEGCQFFPYLTNFKTLKDVFEMSEKRASLTEDQWYVGWSNCDYKVMNVIRKHYERPSFIPVDSESSQLDWIFVGGHGKGAQMHIDFVDRPSWQAQISGMKTWTLIPTPECENICHEMSVTIKKGEILAIDTNQWYHSTYIHPGNMSITIGSEYD
eukprot:gene9011-9975_t